MSILVVGDVMLDVYIDGVVNRISPEAPVPILNVKKQTIYAGGAANVARNIATMGGDCALVSVVGNDTDGTLIAEQVGEVGATASFIQDERRPTTRKTRYTAQGQQIMRVDDEWTLDIEGETLTALRRAASVHLDHANVLVLSDYAKGVLTHELTRWLINEAIMRKIPVIVDPKHANLSRYSGATVLKPNAEELRRATGMPTDTRVQCLTAAAVVADTFNIGSVLVTRASKGMVLYTYNDVFEDAACARDLADVVGAGDTALAALAVGLSEGLDIKDAVMLANKAASIAVGKHGTATVTRQEIQDAFART